MKFTPKEFKENVNISEGSPIKEFFVLLGTISGALFIIYLVLGFALDIVVDKIPSKFEYRLWNFFSKRFELSEMRSQVEIQTQKIVNDLLKYMPDAESDFTVHIYDSAEVNAVALPGGHIVIYKGLLKEIQSENELAMVLAHELGHFANRDHLRGLGRGLVATFLSSFIFGLDSSVNEFLMRMFLTIDRRFSRKQEEAADSLALGLLYKKYGHVAGATDFFEHLSEKEKLPRFLKFFSTHPLSRERIKHLKEEIEMKKYGLREKLPLDRIYKEKEEK